MIVSYGIMQIQQIFFSVFYLDELKIKKSVRLFLKTGNACSKKKSSLMCRFVSFSSLFSSVASDYATFGYDCCFGHLQSLLIVCTGHFMLLWQQLIVMDHTQQALRVLTHSLTFKAKLHPSHESIGLISHSLYLPASSPVAMDLFLLLISLYQGPITNITLFQIS